MNTLDIQECAVEELHLVGGGNLIDVATSPLLAIQKASEETVHQLQSVADILQKILVDIQNQ